MVDDGLLELYVQSLYMQLCTCMDFALTLCAVFGVCTYNVLIDVWKGKKDVQ